MAKQEKGIQLILGCGEKGAVWQPSEDNIILGKVDTRITTGSPQNFLLGDVLALPFHDGSVDRIYGDFILNAAGIRGLNYREIAGDPHLIYCLKACPPKITAWVEENFMEVSRCKRNLEQLRWSLRQTVLEEMWRVLAMDGKIEIIDHKHVVNWVRGEGADLLGVSRQGLVINNGIIEREDFERSASLKTVTDKNEPVSKIILHKTLKQLPFCEADALEFKINGSLNLY